MFWMILNVFKFKTESQGDVKMMSDARQIPKYGIGKIFLVLQDIVNFMRKFYQ
jgi:hypothetical protein